MIQKSCAIGSVRIWKIRAALLVYFFSETKVIQIIITISSILGKLFDSTNIKRTTF